MPTTLPTASRATTNPTRPGTTRASDTTKGLLAGAGMPERSASVPRERVFIGGTRFDLADRVSIIRKVTDVLYEFAPRAASLARGAFGAVTFVGLLGPGLRLPQWLLNLSPLTLVGNPPERPVDSTSLAVLSWAASLLSAAAFVGFRRRSVPQG